MLLRRPPWRRPPWRALALCVGLTGCTPSAAPPTHADPSTMAPPQPSARIADASHSPVSFKRIADFPPPGWQVPRQVKISPDGKLVTFLQSESGGEQMALFAMTLFPDGQGGPPDGQGGSARVLVRAADLVDTHRTLSREEELRRERQRSRIKGVTAYAWADEANVMVLPLAGDIFLRGADSKIRQLTRTPEPDIDPKLCADGSRVAFVRGSELYVVEVDSGGERALTRDAPEGVTRGLSDFNGQEEFNEPSGLWWSPSCDRLAYLEVDESRVGHIPVMGYRQGADLQQHRYPRAGGDNPRVRLGVVELASGTTTWVQMPAAEGWAAAEGASGHDPYLGRVHWSHDGSALYFQRLSRDQKRLALVRADPQSGEAVHLVEVSDPTWTELGDMRPLADGSILWITLHEGHRHLEHRDATGKLQARLTEGDWDVFAIVGVDDQRGRALVIGNPGEPLGRQLLSIPLGGGPFERLTRTVGVHDVNAESPEHGFVDIHSARDRLPRATVHRPDGEVVAEIDVPLQSDFESLAIRPAEIVTVKTDGAPDLYGALLTPRDMKPGARYPVVVMVYGGPAVQTIRDEYNPRLLWQHLADRGVVVWQLDNRGSTGRGHAFESSIHRRLGEVELADQLRGLEYLSSLPFVDSERVGIYGHSYGGYMAVMAMLRAPGRFKVGVAGSPVTDWRFYDSGYTERYMGTPDDNADGYAQSELNALAANLEGKLFIIHALMDENVHFEHTAKLIDALVAADEDFDLLVFPGERHGYRSPTARRYAYRRVIEYFATYL